MHPMTYATALPKIADELDAEGRQEEANHCRFLARIWEEVAQAQARARTETWTAIADSTYPTFVGKTPQGQRLLDLMRYNDVT